MRLGMHSETCTKNKIRELLEQRDKARENKNYILADNLRDEIEALGFKVEDTRHGSTIFKPMSSVSQPIDGNVPIRTFIKCFEDKGFTFRKTNINRLAIKLETPTTSRKLSTMKELRINCLKDMVTLFEREEELIEYFKADPDVLLNAEKGETLELAILFGIILE